MARMLVALCGLSAIFATALIVNFALSHSTLPVLRIVACVLLIDQSMMTVLTRQDSDPEILITVLGVVAIVRGAVTVWQIARTSPSEAVR